jgi:hypothetical protein
MRVTPRSARRNRQDKESGATAIEFVVWTPLLFLFMFGSVQFGLAMFARHVAVTAAEEGARTAREQAETDRNWQAHAKSDAVRWVNQLIGGLVADGVQADPIPVTGGPYPEVGMEVSFSIVSVVPEWQFRLDASSEGPVECYYSQAGACVGPNG